MHPYGFQGVKEEVRINLAGQEFKLSLLLAEGKLSLFLLLL